jgi:hypothetical protein
MDIAERLNEFLKEREFCGKCGSKNYEVDYTGSGKYYLNSENLICKNCDHKHKFDDRINLSELRKLKIKNIIE